MSDDRDDSTPLPGSAMEDAVSPPEATYGDGSSDYLKVSAAATAAPPRRRTPQPTLAEALVTLSQCLRDNTPYPVTETNVVANALCSAPTSPVLLLGEDAGNQAIHEMVDSQAQEGGEKAAMLLEIVSDLGRCGKDPKQIVFSNQLVPPHYKEHQKIGYLEWKAGVLMSGQAEAGKQPRWEPLPAVLPHEGWRRLLDLPYNMNVALEKGMPTGLVIKGNYQSKNALEAELPGILKRCLAIPSIQTLEIGGGSLKWREALKLREIALAAGMKDENINITVRPPERGMWDDKAPDVTYPGEPSVHTR